MYSEFKNKKIFITGHTGFKGSWFISILNQIGADIKGFSLAPKYTNGIYNLINGNQLCNSIIGDINNYNYLNDEIVSFKPDYVFHFAAQPLVRESYKNPLETYQTNVMGTANLLESLKNLKNKCNVLIITTDKVYKNIEKNYSYKETDILGGYDPYSSSKACVEILVNSYRDSFFSQSNHNISIATARAGNVIGGGDRSTDRLIPDIISSIENNRILKIRNPKSVRPWQHVLEPLFGYLKLALYLDKGIKYSSSWNFGPNPNDAISVNEIALMSKKYFPNLKLDFQNNPNNDLHEAVLLMLDINKSKNDLNWKPKWTASQALELTLDWYEKVKTHNPIVIVENQIKYYLKN